MEVLKIKIYQPHAHYRIPFTYQRRHTYPLPPYSTVIGFLCNVLGIRNYKDTGEPCEDENCTSCDYHKLKKIKISICGYFESKTTEYIWFRNLSEKAHISRFGYVENRRLDGQVEHPGGQSPVSIDILNDVHLWIYICHNDSEFLRKLEESIENPSGRIYPLHLGRAEDWIVIDKLKIIQIGDGKKPVYGNYRKFFWIPKKEYSNSGVLGLIYRLPTFYSKLGNGYRRFEYIEVYLSEGEFDGTIKAYIDKEEDKLPIFFLDLDESFSQRI